MTINEERDIVLKALYYDLDMGNRINVDRIVRHLEDNTNIDPNRIHLVLEDLHKEEYIEQFLVINIRDYKITHKGEDVVEHGGFVGRQQKEQQPPISIIGNVIGSAVGNQSRDLFMSGNANTTQLDIAQNNSIQPTDKPHGWFKKSAIWCINNIGKIVIGVIIFTISCFIKYYLDNKHNVKDQPKLEVKPVKKL